MEKKEKKIVDWIISSMIYSLVFMVFTQCGLAFFLVGIYLVGDPLYWIYIIAGISWWIIAVIALALIRNKLKRELAELS